MAFTFALAFEFPLEFVPGDEAGTISLHRSAHRPSGQATFGRIGNNLVLQVHKYNGSPIGLIFPPIVEMTVSDCEPGVRGDTASGGVTKAATLETGLVVRVPLFVKEGEKVKVHTETREFAGRA